jgi:primary-amine oxidase
VLIDPKVCREIHERGHAWKFDALFQKGEEVLYWASSQLGQYNYIVGWTFRDDGAIQPSAGLTGRLQIYGDGSDYTPFGSRTNPEALSTPRIGINHMHNIYWRLDLDIAGDRDNGVNRITQVQHTGPSPVGVSCSIAGTCHINRHTRLTTEVVERVEPFKTWHQVNRSTFNADGRAVGYEIVPHGNQRWTGPTSEQWAAGELYVTTYNACELFAVNNNNPALNPGCGGAPADVQAMVNGQPADGADLVVWSTGHFQHVVRDEDETNMLIEFMGLELQPRSWREVNTLQ